MDLVGNFTLNFCFSIEFMRVLCLVECWEDHDDMRCEWCVVIIFFRWIIQRIFHGDTADSPVGRNRWLMTTRLPVTMHFRFMGYPAMFKCFWRLGKIKCCSMSRYIDVSKRSTFRAFHQWQDQTPKKRLLTTSSPFDRYMGMAFSIGALKGSVLVYDLYVGIQYEPSACN